MGAKHTPGTWVVTGPDDEPYGDIKVGVHQRAVCRLWQDDAPEHSYNAEQWANARLIAAAPDLLTACREAGALIARYIELQGLAPDTAARTADVGIMLGAAIKKAEGRS